MDPNESHRPTGGHRDVPVGERVRVVQPPRSEPGLQFDLVPYSERRPAAPAAELPWPVDGAPFRNAGLDDVLGVYLSSSHGPRASASPLEPSADVPLGLESRVPAVSTLAPGVALDALLAWHTLVGPDRVPLRATLAWVARVLSLVHWVGYPRGFESAEASPSVVTGKRLLSTCLVVPGANLHGLIALTWRAVRDAAEVLHDLYSGPDPAHPFAPLDGPLPPQYPPSVARAIAGLGSVPAYPLRAWARVSTTPKLAQPFRPFYWGRAAVITKAEEAVRHLKSARASVSRDNAPRDERFRTLPGGHHRNKWDVVLRHNVSAYNLACGRALGSAVLAARVLLHVLHRVQTGYEFPFNLTAGPRRWLPTLRTLAHAPVAELDTLFPELVEASLIPLPWLWCAEHEFEAVVRATAAHGLEEIWGIRPDQPDALGRAGASCPVGDVYIAPRRRAHESALAH